MEKKYIIGAALALVVSSMVATGPAHAISACPDLSFAQGGNAYEIFRVINDEWDRWKTSGKVKLESKNLVNVKWHYTASFHGYVQKGVAAIAPLDWKLQEDKSDLQGTVCVYHVKIFPPAVKHVIPVPIGDLSLHLRWNK